VPVAFTEDTLVPLGDEPLAAVVRKAVEIGVESLNDLCDLGLVAPDGKTEVVRYRAKVMVGHLSPRYFTSYAPHRPAFMQVKHSAHQSILRDYLD